MTISPPSREALSIERDYYLVSNRSNMVQPMVKMKEDGCNPIGHECRCGWSSPDEIPPVDATEAPFQLDPDTKYIPTFGIVHIEDRSLICEISESDRIVYRRGDCREDHWFSFKGSLESKGYKEIVEKPYEPLYYF